MPTQLESAPFRLLALDHQFTTTMPHNLFRYSILFAIAVVALSLAIVLIKLLVHAILLVVGLVMVAYVWRKYGSKTYMNNLFKL
jgi:Flp pilus assembly protein TadB